MEQAINDAAKLAGGQASLARAIGVKPPTVNQWVKGERPIPHRFGPAIEKATGGQVTRKELFPDSWQRIWPELARSKRSKAQPTQSAQAGQGADLDQSVLTGPSTMDLTQ